MSELRSAVESFRSETLPDLPDARIEEDFAELQQVIEQLELERLRRLVEIERRRLFEHAVDGEAGIRERRRLHASVSLMGTVRVDGDLDPENGENLLTALSAMQDAESRGGGLDDRTPAQRRADALGEICRQWLDRSDRPQVAGERPHVTVTVGAEVLQSELDHVGPVPPQTARRLACDASVSAWCSRDGRSRSTSVGGRPSFPLRSGVP